jgi:hypothetical protein
MGAGFLIPAVLAAITWPWALTDWSAIPAAVPAQPETDFLKLFQPPEPLAPLDKLVPPTSAGLAWMTDPGLFAPAEEKPHFSVGELGDVMDRQGTGLFAGAGKKGLYQDPDHWRFRGDLSDSFYRRTLKVDVPNPGEVARPFSGRNWNTEDRFQIPVPIPLPVAERLFVFGQVLGSGDALDNRTTTLSGKTGVGVKWSPLGATEVQLRYGTWLNYADVYGATRFQERPQPAIEVLAKMPLIGAWHLDYTGSALPAVQTTVRDQFKQELRLAVPLNGGDNEFEFGARYRWEVQPTPTAAPTPWVDRAELFMGLKFRR